MCVQFKLTTAIKQPLRAQSGLAQREMLRYGHVVAANSATGFGDPIKLAHRRPHTATGAFFMPAVLCYGGCAWDTFGYAGCQLSRFANLRTAATHNRLATVRGSSKTKVGASLMKHSHAPNPLSFQQHIASLKARAISALHADSSLSVRLARYNEAMRRARALEAKGGAQ
ncbi:hypothetical protein ACVTMO_02420 [Pseudomonas segetis]